MCWCFIHYKPPFLSFFLKFGLISSKCSFHFHSVLFNLYHCLFIATLSSSLPYSLVGIATVLHLDAQGIVVRFPTGRRNLSLLHCVQTGFEAKSLSFELGTESVSLMQSGRKMKLLSIRPN